MIIICKFWENSYKDAEKKCYNILLLITQKKRNSVDKQKKALECFIYNYLYTKIYA